MFWLADVFNGPFSPEEMRRHEQWARAERARTIRRLAAGAGRGLARGARAIGSSVRERYQRRQVVQQLRGLDDHLLADIGLTRDDLYQLNRGRWPRRFPDARTPGRSVQAVDQDRADGSKRDTDTAAGRDEHGGWQRAA